MPELTSGHTSYDTDSSIPVGDPIPDSSRSSTATSIMETPTSEQGTSPVGPTLISAPILPASPLSNPTPITTEAIPQIIGEASYGSDSRNEGSIQIDTPSASTNVSITPPTTLPQVLRDVAALSSLPVFSLPLLEMGFSQRHVVHAMQATGIRQGADTRRINELVTWLLEHPISDDEVNKEVVLLLMMIIMVVMMHGVVDDDYVVVIVFVVKLLLSLL